MSMENYDNEPVDDGNAATQEGAKCCKCDSTETTVYEKAGAKYPVCMEHDPRLEIKIVGTNVFDFIRTGRT